MALIVSWRSTGAMSFQVLSGRCLSYRKALDVLVMSVKPGSKTQADATIAAPVPQTHGGFPVPENNGSEYDFVYSETAERIDCVAQPPNYSE